MPAKTIIESASLFEFAGKTRKKATAYKAQELTAKMWLLPDGVIQPLNGRYHHQFLIENFELAQRFGLTHKDLAQDEQMIRLAALRKGFIRIAYESSTGRLVIEGNAKYWTKTVKDTLFMLCADNAGKIDQMTVNLFDDNNQKVSTGSQQLFTMDDAEKLEHLPLISKTLRRKA